MNVSVNVQHTLSSSPIEFLTHVFNRRSVEKDCLHAAIITGCITKTLKSQCSRDKPVDQSPQLRDVTIIGAHEDK